jgi:hypothetical protein
MLPLVFPDCVILFPDCVNPRPAIRLFLNNFSQEANYNKGKCSISPQFILMNNCFVRFSKHCLLFLCLFIPQMLFPQGRQENATLGGAVTDAAGKALRGVSVTINELHRNTITGEDGSFLFRNLPAGTSSIGITYIGYKQVVKKVTVQSNNTTRLAFRLAEDVNHLNGVTVQG